MDTRSSVLALETLLRKRLAPVPTPVACSPASTHEEAAGLFVPIAKLSEDEQLVTGIVLQPNSTDAQGDIYDADVIRRAAHKYLSNYNSATKLGHQHSDFKDWKSRFSLVESYIAPLDFVLGTKTVSQGSWVMSWKVLDSKIWKMVKAGQLTGFSIGGKAKVKNLEGE